MSRPPITAPASVYREAARLYTSGATIAEVAEKIGYSSDVTRRFLLEAGVTIRQGGPRQASDTQRGWNNGRQQPRAFYQRPKLTPQQRDEIRQRLTNGETVRALAAEYAVSTDTIRRYLP